MFELKLQSELSESPNGAEESKKSVWEFVRSASKFKEPREETIGKYRFISTSIETGKGTWDYVKTELFRDDSKLFEWVRNIGYPMYKIIEHNNQEYLWFSENYQGYSVLNLQTLEYNSYLPPVANEGSGFCITSVDKHSESNWVIASGCFWACPYDFYLIDFSDPSQFPYSYYKIPLTWVDNREVYLENFVKYIGPDEIVFSQEDYETSEETDEQIEVLREYIVKLSDKTYDIQTFK